MAKPFSIQAPEDVAKEYGGNKQAIAQAAQMGIVDPTAAVLAGMFIDRMRSAQVMEGGQQPTVAQQVLGGGGLPTPPANPMATAMGAPAPQPAPAMQTPMGVPPEMEMPGMAMGGLASLSVPDAMFDEPDNGGYGDGYAGGGLVAFADGGAATPAPSYYGYSLDPRANMDIARSMFGGTENKYSKMLEDEALAELSEAAQKKRASQDKWSALADFGFRLAGSRSPSLFTALGEAGTAVLPGLMENARLRKTEQKAARRALADLEAGRNTANAQIAAQAMQMQQAAIQGYEADTGRKFQASQNQLGRDLDWRIATLRSAGSGGGGGGGGGGGEGGASGKPLSPTNVTERLKELRKQADESFESAKEAWKTKNSQGTYRALQGFGTVRAAYNRLAEQHGMAPLKEPNYGKNFKGYRSQSGSRGADAGRGRTVKDGIIIQSVTPLP